LATLSGSREEAIRYIFSITRGFNGTVDVVVYRPIEIERLRYGGIRWGRDTDEILRLRANDDVVKMVFD
jgi:hypothetical protein